MFYIIHKSLFLLMSALLDVARSVADNEAAAWQQWRVSTATWTRAIAAKLNKIWDEPSPPLRQTACCELGGEGQQKNT